MTTYEEFVALYLNAPAVTATRQMELVDAVRVATGGATMPRSWGELAAELTE